MTPAQIDRVKDLLAEALRRPAGERDVYLSASCPDDPAVRREVGSLLAQEEVEAPILDQPILGLLRHEPPDGAPRPAALEPGRRIGAYQILRVLDEGGMGTVALARREDDFQKEVALKVIRPDAVSDDTLRRFDNERQLLALVDHPNVARILDGGTTDDGRPYFVMEHVDGLPLDRYCEENGLDVRRRLELFLQVCAAVQVAHQSLIVHRDLKPSNILVAGGGVPKLLDFGIAKRLDADATRTWGAVPMTLRYASPEQVDPRPERPITTASDIYSLGVILYQLLTDRLPYPIEGESFAALVRSICEDEPPPPSSVASRARARRLAGDLDAIVAKALRKDPRQRYTSVERLAGDVHRHLTGRSVLARQGSFAYRTMKLVRRHRVKLAVAAVVALVTMPGTISSTLLWREAAAERGRSDDVLVFLRELFKEALPDRAQGEELSALDVLAHGERDVERLEDPLSRAKLLDTIGDVYTGLGLHDLALAPRERALLFLRERYTSAHPDLAKAINDVASTYYRRRDFEKAEALYREALAMKEDLEGALLPFKKLPPEELDVAKSKSNLGTILKSQLRYEEAESLYREALELRIEAHEPDEEDVAKSLRSLANLLYTTGGLDEAEHLARRALEIRLRHTGPEHTQTAMVSNTLARVLAAQGRSSEAEEHYRRALAIWSRRLGEEHLYTAGVKSNLATLLLEGGAVAAAEALLDEALPVLRGSPRSTALAEARSALGALYAAQGRWDEAEPLLLGAWHQLVKLCGEDATRARLARQRLEAYRDGRSGARLRRDGHGPAR